MDEEDELIHDAFEDARELSERHDWNGDPLRRLAFLTTEVGELAREVLRLQSEGAEAHDRSAIQQRIGAEIYDVVWNAVDLGRLLEVDVMAAAQRKRDYNRDRTWIDPTVG